MGRINVNIMVKLSAIYLCVLATCFIGLPAGHAADEGAHAAEFLSHGVGARALGMGGAFVAVADDATATYWNPAGPDQSQETQFLGDVFRYL